jgi:hypothetical protein
MSSLKSGLPSLLKSLAGSLMRLFSGSASPASSSVSPPVSSAKKPSMVWGAKLTLPERNAVAGVARAIGFPVDWLMACIAFETGETFDPAIVNKASGATGLIQFMPRTAIGLGTTTAALRAMSVTEQLIWVLAYFKPYAGRLRTLEDVYMAILYPAAIGKPDSYVLFDAPAKAYEQNAGLDANRDRLVTKREAAARVREKLERGAQFMGDYDG